MCDWKKFYGPLLHRSTYNFYRKGQKKQWQDPQGLEPLPHCGILRPLLPRINSEFFVVGKNLCACLICQREIFALYSAEFSIWYTFALKRIVFLYHWMNTIYDTYFVIPTKCFVLMQWFNKRFIHGTKCRHCYFRNYIYYTRIHCKKTYQTKNE